MSGARTPLFSRRQSGGVFTIAAVDRVPGDAYFVCSVTGSDAAGYGGNPDKPVATIDYAIGLCTANKGDVIYVLPGHAESISAAGAIACDVAGISIIGLGRGSLRPVVTLAGTAATIAVSAANVLIQNIVITCSIDEVVSCFNVTAAFLTLDAVDYNETASFQLIQFLKTSAAGDDLCIQNCRHTQATAAASAQKWIELIGADRACIRDSIFNLTLQNGATSSTITSTGTAPVDIVISGNMIRQLGGTTQVSAILLVANTTGYVANNRVAAGVTTLAGTIALASCYGSQNYASHTVNKNGILDPVADA